MRLSLILTTLLLSLTAIAEEQKAVLITGATSGIGRVAAEHLAEQGYYVYAGARKDADMEALNAIDNITAVRLDVTKPEQIAAAVEFIKSEGRGLWGIVNNAGVNVIAPLVVADEADFQFLFDVNVFGVYRVTKAFAPMVLESGGRIVNISSISGVLTGGGYGMYAASKHAVEAMTDALHREMDRHGVFVTSVNPGNYASEIGLSRCKRMLSDDNDDNWGLWEERRQQMITNCREALESDDPIEGASPIGVALAIEQALFEDNPRDRYLIVPRQVEAGWTIARAIEELLAFNNRHEFSYSREEIAALIDVMWPYMDGEKSIDDEEQGAELMAFMQAWMNRAETPAE